MTKIPRVLIIEDDDWLAEHYVRTLTMEGEIYAESVSHALAAIDAIDNEVPDVLVLDLLLPGPNAFTLLHELHSHADLALIPVILCTNGVDQLAEEELVSYGVVQMLDKATMLPSDLIAAVKRTTA